MEKIRSRIDDAIPSLRVKKAFDTVDNNLLLETPQDTVLGQILFLRYMNDLLTSSARIVAFEGDTAFCYINTS